MTIQHMVDLHTHSTFSDGTLTPTELVTLAKAQNLSAIALTDHDTIDGIKEALLAGKEINDMLVIPGIELAALYEPYENKEIHIIGLFIDHTSSALLNQLKQIQHSRYERNLKMIDKLTSLGISISLEELEAVAGGEIITRTHYANLMKQKGYISTINEAFLRYLSPGLPGYAEREFLTPKLCIEAITQAGGIAILAHPTLYDISFKQMELLCLNLMEYGLTGLETMYSSYNNTQEKRMKEIAARLGLLSSGGSDFHGANKPHVSLGIGKGNLRVPYDYVEAMMDKKGKC